MNENMSIHPEYEEMAMIGFQSQNDLGSEGLVSTPPMHETHMGVENGGFSAELWERHFK